MSRRAYMPLFVGDYLADTLHLSTCEHGAYLLLIMHYWQSGKPLPDDDARLARILRMTIQEWESIRPVLEPFFDVHSGRWHHGRLEKELAYVAAQSEAQREKAHKSWEARRSKQSTGNATADAPAMPRHSTGFDPAMPPSQPIPTHTKLKEDDDETRAGEFDRLAKRCLEEAGLEHAAHSPGLLDTSPLVRLLKDGFTLEEHLLPSIRVMRARGHRFSSWRYVETAIRQKAQDDAQIARAPPAKRLEAEMDEIKAYLASKGVAAE
jgi:uncharacterized protein YdaU (DUF1376 family)